MNAQDLDLFLKCGMGICLFIVVVNILRYNRRGSRAIAMGAAAALLALVIETRRINSPIALQIAIGVAFFAALATDFVLSFSAKPTPKGGTK